MSFPNDMSRIAGTMINFIASRTTFTSEDTKKLAAHQLIRRTYIIPKASADSATSTTLAANACPGMIPLRLPGRILGARFVPSAAVTASNVNNATFTLEVIDGANGGTSVAAFTGNTAPTANGGIGSLAIAQSGHLSLSNATAAQFSANSTLGIAIAKAGAGGLQLPAGTFAIDVELEGADDGYEV